MTTIRDPRVDAVVRAAVAYCDQLCTFNRLDHPEVHRRRLELATAVSDFLKYWEAA